MEAMSKQWLHSSFAVSSQAPVEVEDELVTYEGSDLSLDSSDSESEEEPAPLPPPAKKSKGSTSAHHRYSGFDEVRMHQK